MIIRKTRRSLCSVQGMFLLLFYGYCTLKLCKHWTGLIIAFLREWSIILSLRPLLYRTVESLQNTLSRDH